MRPSARSWWACLAYVVGSLAAAGQTTARLQTAGTQLTLAADPASPRLVSLQVPGQTEWDNRASEVLIESAQAQNQNLPLSWRLHREASHIDEHHVLFFYESLSPHLRLSWEWRVRSAIGSGIYGLFVPASNPVAMSHLHIGIWWGSGMLVLGLAYVVRFRPNCKDL